MSHQPSLRNVELDCLLEAIFQYYGYDFRNYTKASLKRRVDQFMILKRLQHISEIIPLVLHDEREFDQFVNAMTVCVTDMFRDYEVFKYLREQVIPILKTYSRINIWHAGCATGEEVYSMAILLHEEGLLERSRLYATDLNRDSISRAKNAIYPAEKIKQFTKNYQNAGGTASFSDYYHANYQSAKLKQFLLERVTFSYHNLVTDHVFSEMHLIFCRNVLIYFDQDLQDKVFELVRDSLTHKGFLVLGDKESLHFSSVKNDFEAMDERLRIFRDARLA